MNGTEKPRDGKAKSIQRTMDRILDIKDGLLERDLCACVTLDDGSNIVWIATSNLRKLKAVHILVNVNSDYEAIRYYTTFKLTAMKSSSLM